MPDTDRGAPRAGACERVGRHAYATNAKFGMHASEYGLSKLTRYAKEVLVAGGVQKREAIVRARLALGLTQAQLADVLVSSQRTVARWEAGQSTPTEPQLTHIASLVYAADRDLAAELLRHAGTTLVAVGLEPSSFRAAAPPEPPAAPSPARPQAKTEDLVDIVVLAGVVASGAPAADVRRWLHTMARRGCDVGLTMQDVVAATAPPPPDAARSPAAAAAAPGAPPPDAARSPAAAAAAPDQGGSTVP